MSSKYAVYGGINVEPKERSMDQEPLRPSGEEVIYPTINYSLAVRDLVDDLQNFPASIQPHLSTGMYMALTALAPWLCERFLERLKSLPVAADTASVPDMESIYLMGYPDRGGRDR